MHLKEENDLKAEKEAKEKKEQELIQSPQKSLPVESRV
jgi:hypothetical protein